MIVFIFTRLALAIGFYVLAGGKLPSYSKAKGL